MILGRNAAARELGISPQALGKAAKTGRVSQTAEGMYDVEACREQLRRNSNPIKQASARAQQQRPKAKHARRTAPPAARVEPPVEASSEENGAASAAAVYPEEPNDGLRAITIQRELLKLKKERREFLREGKRLVDGRKVRAEMIERAANERQALLNIPKRWAPSMATEFGVEERKAHSFLTTLVRQHLTERSTVPVNHPPASPKGSGPGPVAPYPPSPEMPPPPPAPRMENPSACA